jgi:hypothetical protein
MLQGKLPAEWCLLTKLGPQVSLFPVPIFGVNNEAALFICGAWSLWNGHNARQHGHLSSSPKAVARHIASLIEEMICLNSRTREEQPRQVFSWNKPQTGWLKVNTDASFVLSTHTGTGGAVIRDEFGRMVGASANFYNHIPGMLTA